jgi:hypothetical protein
MLKRLLNIALIFSLIISMIGVSTSKVFCMSMGKVMSKSCCEKSSKEDGGCCKNVTVLNKLTSDITAVNASVEMPQVLLFAVAYLEYFNSSIAMLSQEHGYFSYSPPLKNKDIPVLIQCFRI